MNQKYSVSVISDFCLFAYFSTIFCRSMIDQSVLFFVSRNLLLGNNNLSIMETERPDSQDSDFLGMPQPGQIAYGNISNSGSNFTTGDIVMDSSMVNTFPSSVTECTNKSLHFRFRFAGMAPRLTVYINAVDHLHHILQFTGCWLLLYENNQSLFVERRLLQNWFVND